MKSVAFCTLGCKVNQYETDAMMEEFARAGYEVRPFEEKADIYVVNTCTVTNIADRKSRQMLRRARKRNPEAIIVAAGCYVQAAEMQAVQTPGSAAGPQPERRQEEGIAVAGLQGKTIPAAGPQPGRRQVAADALDAIVDIMIGNDRKGRIVEAVEEYLAGRENHYILDIGASRSFESLKISEITGHTRAYIKVQDGCNQFCSYCLIPYVRGRIRSRSMEEVLEEVRGLVSGNNMYDRPDQPAADSGNRENVSACACENAWAGIREIVLTGIHISSYGLDWTHENSGGEEDYGTFGRSRLIDLIEALSGINGLRRIRLSSLEPRIITEAFVRRLSKVPQFCPHFHLSLQSGCNATLARMNRHYTTQQYLESCALIRRYFPLAAITTDVIVGFPGETEEEFSETCSFAQQVGFADMHIFRYSRREGTRAAGMPGQVDPQKQAARSDRLQEIACRLQEAFLDKCKGSREEVLLEEYCRIDGRDYMTGYSRNYIRCLIPVKEQPGSIIEVSMLRVVNDTMLCEHLI